MNRENWSLGLSNKTNWYYVQQKSKKKSTILKMLRKFGRESKFWTTKCRTTNISKFKNF